MINIINTKKNFTAFITYKKNNYIGDDIIVYNKNYISMILNPTPKYLFTILCLFILLCSCTELYTPKISRNFSALVVDGQITNENKPIEIKIYHTISMDTVSTKDITVPERNATIEIYNDLGDSDSFYEIAPGTYHNTSLDFIGEIGRTYWIKIKTEEGVEYESEPETMTPPVEITKIYGEEFSHYINKDKKLESVKFYFDAKDEYNQANFLRWEALESWEWHCPFHANLPDSSLFSEKPSSICYPSSKISNINVFDASLLGDKEMIKLPITFSTREEQKLIYNYYIKLNVRSVSFKNYSFWNHIKEVNQSSGNLFDRTPGNVEGNISSVDGKHSVVGYFEVSSVSTKSNTFNKSMFDVNFEIFPPECIEQSQLKTPPDGSKYYVTHTDYSHGDIVYYYRLIKCFDCTVSYSSDKPSFWQ